MIDDIVMQIDGLLICTDNGVGDEGAKALGEALKLNNSLTQLNLGSMTH